MKKPPIQSLLVRPAQVLALLGLALGESALAVFQWQQLRVLKGGGKTVCGVSESVSCDAVWTTPFAELVHQTLRVPVAGLGLAWGLAAAAVCAFLLSQRAGGKKLELAIGAVRALGVLGVLACLVFAGVSLAAAALCLTCLATYALVVAFAVVAVKTLPAKPWPVSPDTVVTALGALAVAYLVVLIPARSLAPAPRSNPFAVPPAQNVDAHLRQYLSGLSDPERQVAREGLSLYRQSPPFSVGHVPVRARYGPADAKVRIVEWTDIRCGHCRHLAETMEALRQVMPAGSFSVEARHFPLDGACNPGVPRTEPDGVRCLAAKVQICLEPQPDFWSIRDALFSEQQSLTPQRVMELGSSGKLTRAALEACVQSPETASKLQEDLAYAQLFRPRGTPLVAINGREVSPPVGPLLYALILTGGNAEAPGLSPLSP